MYNIHYGYVPLTSVLLLLFFFPSVYFTFQFYVYDIIINYYYANKENNYLVVNKIELIFGMSFCLFNLTALNSGRFREK